MSGVSFRFSAGDAIDRATVNQNFSDLATATSTIRPTSVMDGQIHSSLISPSAPSALKAFYHHEFSGAINSTGGGTKDPIVGSNAAGGVQIAAIGNDDVVLISSVAEFTYTNPVTAPAGMPFDVGGLSLEGGQPGTNAPIPGSGADLAARTIETLHGLNGAGKYDQTLYACVHMEWLFQATLPAVPDNQYLTLYWQGNGNLDPFISAAGIYVYIIKR